jgi:hypothetical protein
MRQRIQGDRWGPKAVAIPIPNLHKLSHQTFQLDFGYLRSEI